eukprot:7813554-Karenia_brevis.AAC.1
MRERLGTDVPLDDSVKVVVPLGGIQIDDPEAKPAQTRNELRRTGDDGCPDEYGHDTQGFGQNGTPQNLGRVPCAVVGRWRTVDRVRGARVCQPKFAILSLTVLIPGGDVRGPRS